MTLSKVVLCVLGTVALLDVASAKGLMKSRVPKELPVGRGLEGIKRGSAQVGKLISRLGKEQARRLTEGNGQTAGQVATSTALTMYIDQDGNPSCNMDVAQPTGPPMNIQYLIDSRQCTPEDGESTSWGFDGRSVIHRTFTNSSDCRGPREVVTLPCGTCVFRSAITGTPATGSTRVALLVEGGLCADVPAPAAHITFDTDAPGKCISSPPPPSVFKMPIWEGCYLAPSYGISHETIAFVKNHSRPDIEVYAKVYSAFDSTGGASRLIYSTHNDTDCASPPYELFGLSCDCLSPQDDMVMDGFDSLFFHLTGEFCANAVQWDFRAYTFMHSTVPCTTTPVWKGSMSLGVCTPESCTWDQELGEPCGDRHSIMAVQLASDGSAVRRLQQGSDMGSNMDSEGPKRIQVFEYPGGDCNGQPEDVGTYSCGGCQEAPNDEGDEGAGVEENLYVKIIGHFCGMGGHGGQCKKVARSMIPPEIEDRLMPCMSM